MLRIEQMESQSSWRSGRTPTTPVNDEWVPHGSPVSLVHPHVGSQTVEAGLGQGLRTWAAGHDVGSGLRLVSREQLVSQSIVQRRDVSPKALVQ